MSRDPASTPTKQLKLGEPLTSAGHELLHTGSLTHDKPSLASLHQAATPHRTTPHHHATRLRPRTLPYAELLSRILSGQHIQSCPIVRNSGKHPVRPKLYQSTAVHSPSHHTTVVCHATPCASRAPSITHSASFCRASPVFITRCCLSLKLLQLAHGYHLTQPSRLCPPDLDPVLSESLFEPPRPPTTLPDATTSELERGQPLSSSRQEL